MDIKNTDSKYVANTYARYPLVLTHGCGSLLYDENGKEYIDLTSGIAVNTMGVCDNEWVDAVKKQLDTLNHTSNLYYTEPCARLAQMLCERTGMKKVFFSNSGAEANECAIKAARKYAHDKYGDERSVIVTLNHGFHGRTVTTLSATGQDHFHKDFGPFTQGFVYVEPNDISEIYNAVNAGNVAGIMLELVQGEGGVNVLDVEYVKQIEAICREKDIVLVIDEVQTGNGRTGSLYAFMQYGISPDIVSTAKGLAGGLPLGATMLGEKMEGVYVPGTHGSTFGGNPICCAGAVSILERLDDNLLSKVRKKSEYIFSRLNKSSAVKSVSGLGLMIGIQTDKSAKEIIGECMERGVLVLSAKTKIRLLPALNIPFEALEKAINILMEIIEK
ncbi:MAG: aspartate aminotransferase family protein [Clostridiales bacterium]|nr:aspartate aminotransferase family protein [Clostridiales bacterium]